MISLTFTQVTGGTAAVTISAAVVYGTDYYKERLNQYVLTAADGLDTVYDKGPNRIRGVLILKGVSYAHGTALRTWLESTIYFSKNTFKIGAVANLDLGLGDNTELSIANGAVDSVRYDGGTNLKGVFEQVAPKHFNIRFPYRLVKA